MKPTDRLELLIGGFYMQTHYDHYQKLRIDFAGGATYDLADDTYVKGAPGLFQLNLQDQDNWSGSVFAQSYFNITDQLRCRPASADTHENTEMLASTATSGSPSGRTSFEGTDLATGLPNTPFGTAAPPKGSESWDNVGWKLGFDYQFGEAQMAYLTWARGFKSGGFWAASASRPTWARMTLRKWTPTRWASRPISSTGGCARTPRCSTRTTGTCSSRRSTSSVRCRATRSSTPAALRSRESSWRSRPCRWTGSTLTGSVAYLKAEYDKFIYTTSNYAPPGQVRVTGHARRAAAERPGVDGFDRR